MTFLLIIRTIVKVACLVLLAFMTSYMFFYGKSDSGIKKDYAYFSAFLLAALLVT